MKLPCCDRSGLSDKTCICDLLLKQESQCQFWLLTHDCEFTKPTNTGKLIRAILPETQIIAWSRVDPSEQLLTMLSDRSSEAFLVFPEEYAIYQQASVQENSNPSREPGKVFVIIDSTWQQARKIYRQSPYLHNLPLLDLNPGKQSVYSLRRNQKAGHLCTAEVAAEVLRVEGEASVSAVLETAVSEFCEAYRAARAQ